MAHRSVNLSRRIQENAPYLMLVSFLVIVFLLGGGARDDLQSLVILRPLAALYIGYALWGLTPEQARLHRGALIFAGALVLLPLLQLVPLPPAWWSAISGRDLMLRADQIELGSPIWRPLSVAPHRTINSLFSLLPPLAVLLLFIRCSPEQRLALVTPLIALGLLSGAVGLLQTIGSPDGPLYFYRVTNRGLGVGLFANRNHQAVLLACLFPMLAFFAAQRVHIKEQAQLRLWLALAAGALLVPLVLVAGSRQGLLLAIAGLAVAPFVYERPETGVPIKRQGGSGTIFRVVAIAGGISLVLATVLLSRARALTRLFGGDGAEELRWIVWGPIARLSEHYAPLGSGLGTFVEVYQVIEPDARLGPEYLNHAHNDFLELVLTGGLPALALLAVYAIWWVRSAYSCLATRRRTTTSIRLARLGAFIGFILALASVVDYPLRTPSLACLFVIATLWMYTTRGAAASRGAGALGDKSAYARPTQSS